MTKFELPEKPKKTNTSEDFNNLRKAVDELDKFDYTWKTYANKADCRINAANKHIEELERENQRLVAENMAVKTLVDNAKPQQALPVVPECVDYEIKYRRNNSYSGIEPSDGLLLMQVFQDLNCNGRMDRSGEEGYWQDGEFYKWMQSSQNFPIFFKAVAEGYTVEKPQLFYLKHIDMSKADKECDWYLVNDGELDHDFEYKGLSPKQDRYKFTQAEIDSMNTGSYEQIEVVE